MNYGFIGTGNLPSAVIRGLITSKAVDPEEICVFDIDASKSAALAKEFDITVSGSAAELTETVKTVLIGVKPNIVPSVLENIKPVVQKSPKLIVSLAAGKTLTELSACLPQNTPIVRVMTNLNSAIGEGMSGICGNSFVTEEAFCKVQKLFGLIGKTITLDESLFSTFLGLASSAPAIVYMFIDTLARSGVKNGMDKKTALAIASQTVIGSAKILAASDKHPWELIDNVCSPSGTTIEGITSLLSTGFESSVINAVDAFIKKDSKK